MGTQPAGAQPGCFVRCLSVLLIGVVASLGLALWFIGAWAIHRRELDLEWRSGGGLAVGPVGVGIVRRAGVEQFRGADAVRMGVGFLAGGTSFNVGAVCLLASLFPRLGRRLLGSGWGRRKKLLTASSLAGLVVCAGAVAPPRYILSRSGASAFWLTTCFLCGVVLFLLLRGRPPSPWAKVVFPGIVISGIVAGFLSPPASVGICFAIFFVVFVSVHIGLFWFEGDLGRGVKKQPAPGE